ncbi:MAG: (2Fe-2S)-binding protein [Actinobacteria bacterium]|nr:(2Fe-2S)-binding protein [Actinomycetota bacterium]
MSEPGRTAIELTVNGETRRGEVEPRMTLADFLREELRLTGTHVGCEDGFCGACTVHLDGSSVRSCLLYAVQAAGREVHTVESLAGPDGELHPLQEAFRRNHGLQCGFCTPGMLMSALELAQSRERDGAAEPPDEAEIRTAIAGNICRCTGYQGIVDAIAEALRD